MAWLDNLVSYWKLDEASSTRYDSHSTNNLTEVGSVDSTTGIFNSAASFNHSGAIDRLQISDNSSLSMGDIDFTLSVWAYSTSYGSQHNIFSKRNSNIEYQLYYFNNHVRWLVSPDGTFDSGILLNCGSLTTNAWHHLIAWHDSSANQVGVIKDGGTETTASYSAGVLDGTAPVEIGHNAYWEVISTPSAFYGYIDEVALWKRVLTSQERTDLYSGGAGLAYPFTTPKGIILPRRHRRVANLVRM